MKIFGNKKIVQALEKSAEDKNISQAYAFIGPEGVGKFFLALKMAKELCGTGENNPDIMIIKPEIEEKKGIIKQKEIKLDQIKELQRHFVLSGKKGGFRVGIIDNAEKMNKSAQNAMLKTLEDPAPGTVAILIIQNPEKIVLTIMSRCQIKKFGPVSKLEMEQLFSEKGVKEAELKAELVFWSLGRPGIAVSLIDNPEELKARKLAVEEVTNLFKKNITEKFRQAEEMSKDSGLVIKKMNWWIIALRELALGKIKNPNISSQKAYEVINKIIKCQVLIRETNTNIKLVLENLLLNF